MLQPKSKNSLKTISLKHTLNLKPLDLATSYNVAMSSVRNTL